MDVWDLGQRPSTGTEEVIQRRHGMKRGDDDVKNINT